MTKKEATRKAESALRWGSTRINETERYIVCKDCGERVTISIMPWDRWTHTNMRTRVVNHYIEECGEETLKGL